MSIFSRIGEIINANISNMLDKAEHPEKMVRLMIHEMEDTLTEIKSSAAEVIAERIRIERELKRCRGNVDDWSQKAALAVTKGRDDLARLAIERRLANQKEAVYKESRLHEAVALVKQYHEDIARLEAQLQKAYRRQKDILNRMKRVKHGNKVEDRIYEMNRSAAFSRFDEFETRLDHIQAEHEINQTQNQSLEQKFQELERSGEVEEELDKLKGKPSKKSKG